MIDYQDIMIAVLLCSLVGACFWLGYQYSIERAVENTLKVLEDEDIIRLIETNGELEVYSGSKIYDGDKNG